MGECCGCCGGSGMKDKPMKKKAKKKTGKK